MSRFLMFIAFWFCLLNVFSQNQAYSLKTDTLVNYADLRKGFTVPPAESRLRCYWWWLNGLATKESITRDLEEMKAKGYGGASIVDAGSSNYNIAQKTKAGPVFMSPAWMDLYKHAVKEADRLGVELSLNVQSGWNPGGPCITPELAMKKIVWSEISLSGGKRIRVKLPTPEVNLYYRDILVQAIPNQKDAPIKEKAILNWGIKSFQEKIGWKGIYPLYKLRDEYPDSVPSIPLRKEEIIDLTAYFKDSILSWTAPAGEWTIIRYGYTCTGARTSTTSDGWNGLSLDHLSPEAFALFSDSVIKPLMIAATLSGNSLRFLQTDSWEMDLVSWTKSFPAEFKKFRNYDLVSYMPVLTGRIVENREVSDRFLYDYRKTIGECIEKYHYRLFYELAHQYGLGIHPESGGPHSAPVDALKIMAISDYPQGEFWAMANTHRIKDDERLSVRQSACVAHTNGKKIVAAEGPTSIGPQWERSPKDLKGNIDRVFCSGVNRIEWHTFTSSPKEFGLPGNEYFAGTHLNPNVTWWNKAGDFISYLNRCSYMLQQGLFVADVLFYYGDDVPGFVFLKEEIPQLKKGYDWDKCSKEIITDKLIYDGKKLRLPDGMTYRLLMLDTGKAVDLRVLQKIEKLVSEGMTLVADRPVTAAGLSNYPENEQLAREIINRLWGKLNEASPSGRNYGKGRVVGFEKINEVLAEMHVKPDFEFSGNQSDTDLDYIHRTTSGQEIYFISNRFSRKAYNDFQYRYIPTLPDRYEQVECKFRITGKVPELWNPITGEISPILTFREENGQTIIPLHFPPEGSSFIVFRDKTPDAHIIKIVRNQQSLFPVFTAATRTNPYLDFCINMNKVYSLLYEPGKYEIKWSDGHTDSLEFAGPVKQVRISGNWSLQFDPVWGPSQEVKIDSLKSWTDFNDPTIRYYSGTATYKKTIIVDSVNLDGSKILLDLGNVQELAMVKINGRQLQARWCAPFQYDVTSILKIGENTLEVEVINLWVNRLVGDGKIPESQRKTRTNVIKFNVPGADQYLRSSGLLGPVTLRFVPVNKLRNL